MNRTEYGIESKSSSTADWLRIESKPTWTREDAERQMHDWYRPHVFNGEARIVERTVSDWTPTEEVANN